MRYGWRARIGQIRPTTTIESSEEWRRVAPEGVAFIDARTLVRRVNTEGLAEMRGQVAGGADPQAVADAWMGEHPLGRS